MKESRQVARRLGTTQNRRHIALLMALSFACFPLASLTTCEVLFIRGDSNGDHHINLADIIFTLSYAFRGTMKPRCLDAADTNDDGRIDISDGIHAMQFLFRGGGPPPPPYPLPGDDPTADRMSCSGAVAELELEWSAVDRDVEDNPEQIAYYTAYYGREPGLYTHSQTSSFTRLVLSDLECDVTYYIAVTATDVNGVESEFSNEVVGVPQVGP